MAVLGAHPARLDLYVHPGDPVDFSVPVLDATGASQDLTSWTCAAAALGPAGELLHDFAPAVVDNLIQVAATSTQTEAWTWSVFAARLEITATPPAGGPVPITTGWIRLYRP